MFIVDWLWRRFGWARLRAVLVLDRMSQRSRLRILFRYRPENPEHLAELRKIETMIESLLADEWTIESIRK